MFPLEVGGAFITPLQGLCFGPTNFGSVGALKGSNKNSVVYFLQSIFFRSELSGKVYYRAKYTFGKSILFRSILINTVHFSGPLFTGTISGALPRKNSVIIDYVGFF